MNIEKNKNVFGVLSILVIIVTAFFIGSYCGNKKVGSYHKDTPTATSLQETQSQYEKTYGKGPGSLPIESVSVNGSKILLWYFDNESTPQSVEFGFDTEEILDLVSIKIVKKPVEDTTYLLYLGGEMGEVIYRPETKTWNTEFGTKTTREGYVYHFRTASDACGYDTTILVDVPNQPIWISVSYGGNGCDEITIDDKQQKDSLIENAIASIKFY